MGIFPLIIIIVCLLLSGGMLDISVSIVGILLCAYIALGEKKNKTLYLNSGKNKYLLLPLITVIIAIIVSFWSIDYSSNMLGCLRLLIIVLWAYAVAASKDDLSDMILYKMPFISAVIVIFGLLLHFIFDLALKQSLNTPFLTKYFIVGRMSGPFQYANTYGIFLLLCIVIQISKIESADLKVVKKREIVILGVNILGFILTGSRSSMLLFLGYIIYKSVKSKMLRPYMLSGLALLFVITAISYFVLGNTQNLGRLLTLTKESTSLTVWERALYYIDGIRCLISHPFGLGYLGYEYIQGSIQTGAYETIFVHNDLLQFAIDYGIIPALILLFYFGYQIFKGRQAKLKKELLVLLLISILVDFHLQYLFMGMLLVLLIELPKFDKFSKGKVVKKDGKKMQGIPVGVIATEVSILLALIFIYLSIPFAADNLFGNYDFALSVYPEYSPSQDERIVLMDDFDTINNLTDSILKKNENNPRAWMAKTVIEEISGNYEGMCQAMDKSLALSKYNIDLYKEYVASLDGYLADETISNKELLMTQKKSIEDRLSLVIEETNSIAYKLKMPDMKLY